MSEVKCSQTMYDDIRAHGGKAIMWKTGHSLIKAKMKETAAAMAGEMSGHLFFADRYFGYDDAIYAGLQDRGSAEEAAGRQGRPRLFSRCWRTCPAPATRRRSASTVLTISSSASSRKRRQLFSRTDLALRPREVITVDGVRAVFDSGWGLIRASNTQPVLVMRFEAGDPEKLAEIRTFMEAQVRKLVAQAQSEHEQ